MLELNIAIHPQVLAIEVQNSYIPSKTYLGEFCRREAA